MFWYVIFISFQQWVLWIWVIMKQGRSSRLENIQMERKKHYVCSYVFVRRSKVCGWKGMPLILALESSTVSKALCRVLYFQTDTIHCNQTSRELNSSCGLCLGGKKESFPLKMSFFLCQYGDGGRTPVPVVTFQRKATAFTVCRAPFSTPVLPSRTWCATEVRKIISVNWWADNRKGKFSLMLKHLDVLRAWQK